MYTFILENLKRKNEKKKTHHEYKKKFVFEPSVTCYLS